MPNTIADYTPWRVLLWVHNRLMEIAVSGGYNTQPLVTLDYDAYRQASTKHALYVACTSVNVVNNDLGGGNGATRATVEIPVTIFGSANYGTDSAQMSIMALMQDCQTMLSTHVDDMRATLGRGVTMRFTGAMLFPNVLDAANEAASRLEVTFAYAQKSTW